MENETRSSRSKQEVKTPMKTSMKVLLTIATVVVVALMIFAVSVFSSKSGEKIKEVPESAISRVESKNAAEASKSVSESNAAKDNTSEVKEEVPQEQISAKQEIVIDANLNAAYESAKSTGGSWKKVDLGTGRDASGQRDIAINAVNAKYHLGDWQSEAEFTPDNMSALRTANGMPIRVYEVEAERGSVVVTVADTKQANGEQVVTSTVFKVKLK